METTRTYGSGTFGRWATDAAGRPAYDYACTGDEDHWHLVGNDRINATAHAAGHVQLYDWSRGGKCLNRWEPDRGHYSGGFKFVVCGSSTFSTLHPRLPEGATQDRRFGVGYVQRDTQVCGLRIEEHIAAPHGDDPVLLSTTRITNHSETPLECAITEFWDVHPHQLTVAPIITHNLDRYWAWRRRQHNRLFLLHPRWDPAHGMLSVDFPLKHPRHAPQPESPAPRDYHLKTFFLAALDPLPEGYTGWSVDARAFFGNCGLHHPPGAAGAAEGRLFAPACAYRHHAILAMRRVLRLAPGESVELRYLCGYADRSDLPQLVARHREPQPAPRPRIRWRGGEADWLDREVQWHSYYLQAGSYYSDYFTSHFVDQGSAYAYLHGLAGAHRDFALFTLPLVYLRPDLAKDTLRFACRAQRAHDGGLPYAHYGHAKTGGFGVHSWSSDQDLFFFWAMAEYLGATRDFAFLDEVLPYYPRESGAQAPVREHLRAAFRHLTRKVGLGRHGLIRSGSGDWNDVLLAYSRLPLLTLLRGESALNAGLATVALPALADALAEIEPDFAAALRDFAAGQARALETLWNGQWLTRGYLGYGEARLGHDRLFLDAQSFPVLGGVWDETRVQRLFETIARDCVVPQGVGARCLWPPMRGAFLEPGSDTNGGTWAAIDCWLACAWAKVDPAAAWRFYRSSTLAARAEAYPAVWYGVWSGPDAYNAAYHARPGETFNLNFTAMTRYPVMNMNRHAAPLFALLRLAGIEPCPGGLRIAPRLPFADFHLETPLISVECASDAISGAYTPVCNGSLRLEVALPEALRGAPCRLEVDARPLRFERVNRDRIAFTLGCRSGTTTHWRVSNAG